MCGIAGIFEYGRGARVDQGLLARMTQLIAHRGPDDSGHWVDGNVALGHRRLSIIDVSPTGHQPMGSEDGSVWITYNGECYNYAELAVGLRARGHIFRSSSDTEVILRLYQERGERFLDLIDGMFALAIWDGRKRCLLLARDRIGIKPLYYAADDRRFLFASEMKALLADPQIGSDIDQAALAEYFHLLSIPDERCILKGVEKLPAGSYLKVTERGVERRRYWDIPVRSDDAMSPAEAVREFETRFAGSVNSHMVADVPVGAFLSGGVDFELDRRVRCARHVDSDGDVQHHLSGAGRIRREPVRGVGRDALRHPPSRIQPDAEPDRRVVADRLARRRAVRDLVGLCAVLPGAARTRAC